MRARATETLKVDYAAIENNKKRMTMRSSLCQSVETDR